MFIDVTLLNKSYKTEKNTQVAIVGALPNSTRLKLEDSHGEKLLPDRIIATKMLAEKFGIKKGDELHVVSDDTMKEYTLRVDVVANSYAGEFLFMPIGDLNAMLGDLDTSWVYRSCSYRLLP